MNPGSVRSTGVAGGLLLAVLGVSELQGEGNVDESKVGDYELPDPLKMESGEVVADAEAWRERRRPELMKLFEEHVYGTAPRPRGELAFELLEDDAEALDGAALRTRVRITLPEHPDWEGIEMMIHRPPGEGPFACFVGLSFVGNQAVTEDPAVPISTRWMRAMDERGIVDHRATEASRGTSASRWPLRQVVDAGFAVASAYYGDIEPDLAAGGQGGVREVLEADGADPGGSAIAAWAWGLGRMLDYLEREPALDAERAVVIGHSRLGKTALWAGASDPRFAMVVSNNSGEGGAALMRRDFGETTAAITSRFPHWFVPKYAEYADNEEACPVDQHLLIALIAPRPVHIGSASEDLWADPRGELLGGHHAGPVYALFGKDGLDRTELAPPGEAVGDFVVHHLRAGGHDLTAADWAKYLETARRHEIGP